MKERNLKIVPVALATGRGHELEIQRKIDGNWVGQRPRVKTRVEAIVLRNRLSQGHA